MESIGEKLRSTREHKKITIKDVVSDTNINPVYLNALENEDFDKFPSETYLIGFLKSYAEYLKLDADEIVQDYRGYKIGESPTPLEELTKPTRTTLGLVFSNFMAKQSNNIYMGVIVLAGMVLLGGIIIFLVSSSGNNISKGSSIATIKNKYNEKTIGTKIEKIHSLQLSKNRGFEIVNKNEAVQFLVGSKEFVFLLREIKENSIIIEFLESKQIVTIEMDKESKIKVDKSPRDIFITLKGLTENSAKVLVKLGKNLEEVSSDKKDNEISNIVNNTKVEVQNKKNLKIVFEAEFIQKSFVEIYLDGNPKKRGFVPKGSKERWEASEYIQIKIGNAGGLNVKVNGKEYKFGKLGQVANKVITWQKDVKNPNLYHIVVKDW